MPRTRDRDRSRFRGGVCGAGRDHAAGVPPAYQCPSGRYAAARTGDARRAVELKPGSAHSYQALMDVLFARGEHAPALEAGERAVTLNPYHPNVLGCYGARLVALGQVEKGARYLREAAEALSVRPP